MTKDHVTKVTPDWNTRVKGRNPELRGQKYDIYQFIKSNPGVVRSDVSKALGMKSSTATARVSELIDAGLIFSSKSKREESHSGVSSQTLYAYAEHEHRLPRDRVRVRLSLIVDEHGNYTAQAKVVGGNPHPLGKHRVVKTKDVTVVAPYPNDYMHLFVDSDVAEVPVSDTIEHEDLIVDSE